VGRSGTRCGLSGGGLYRILILVLATLAGCGYKLGPPDVIYGEAEPMILVQPSTDARRWYVPVESETLGPQIFFFDTGYGYTACDDDLVEGLGLTTKGRVIVRGELGALRATKTRLPPMKIGGHTVNNVTCQVRDIGGTSSINDPREVPVAGVIGMDVLRQFRLILDPEHGVIHLVEPDKAVRLDRKADDVVSMRREWFGLRSKVPLSVGDKTTWPLLDTGSTTTWIDGKRLGLEISRLQEGVAFRGTGKTTTDVRTMYYYDLPQVAIGSHATGNTTLTDRRKGPFEPGLLGLNVARLYKQELDFRRELARYTRVEPMDISTWGRWHRDGQGVGGGVLLDGGSAAVSEVPFTVGDQNGE